MSTLLRRSRIFDPESLGGWRRDTPRQVDIVTAACAWRRARSGTSSAFRQTFFMYGEDADLARAARKLGYHPAITPEA